MTGNDRPSNVTDIRSRRRYAPDLVSLTCSQVATARARAGLSAAEFADALRELLKWPQLGPDLVRAWESTVDPPGRVLTACAMITRREGPDAPAPGDEVAVAAAEAEAEQAWLLAEPGQLSVASLWDEAARVARAPNRGALETFGASHRIRSTSLDLAEQTRRPAARSDLYTIAGQSTALMASTAFDLNRWDEAATLARSAVSYAALVGNASLQAWTFGLAALLANWRHEPDNALDHFRHGLEVAPTGTPRARLRYIAARSYALLGDSAATASVLDLARHDQDTAGQHGDSLCEGIGGEFAFARARADACAAAAWLDLGSGREAQLAARRALSDLTALPPGRQPLSQVTGARIDLATACLLSHDRDEAAGELAHVFAVPAPLRNVSLAGRLARSRQALTAPYWRQDTAARHLRDAIGEWLTDEGPEAS
jgi:hypothetical protein